MIISNQISLDGSTDEIREEKELFGRVGNLCWLNTANLLTRRIVRYKWTISVGNMDHERMDHLPIIYLLFILCVIKK